MRISLGPFRARLPRISDRGLPESNATVATGCDLRSGEIKPFRKSALVKALGVGQWDSIYRWYDANGTDHWLQFPGDVDVIQGPVADDVWQRVYWTGDERYDEPRMSYSGPIQAGEERPSVAYKLGVPAPSSQLSVDLDSAITGAVESVVHERPIVINTVSPHGLESGSYVQLNTVGPAPADGELDLPSFLNQNDFTITVIGERAFSLDQTDAFNVDYSAVDSGTFEQHFPLGTLSTRFYTHTYVTNLGEEGPPSEPVQVDDVAHSQSAALTLPLLEPTDAQGRIIERRRIYRTATGARGALFQFVGEVDIASASFHDDIKTENLGEPLPSAQWDAPNSRMKGIRLAAQGFAIGFFDNKIAFSEPYMVHAWPTSYQLALDYEVVAIEVVDGAIVVGTKGRPYLIQGVEPRSMLPKRLESNYACISKRSMTTLGYAAIYASVEGLVLVGGGQARLLTEGALTEEEWAKYNPGTIHGYSHQGRYVGFYETLEGAKKGFVFDPRSVESGIVDLDVWAKDAFTDEQEQYLYFLNDSNDILRWDDGQEGRQPYVWRSKEFVTAKPGNMAAAKIAASSYPITFRLFGDGILRHEAAINSNDPFSLPAGYLARRWHAEFEGVGSVQDCQISDSYMELE